MGTPMIKLNAIWASVPHMLYTLAYMYSLSPISLQKASSMTIFIIDGYK